MVETNYGEYSRDRKDIWSEPPIGGNHSILSYLEKDLNKTKELIQRLEDKNEAIQDENEKKRRKEFIEVVKFYNNILGQIIFDLKNYSSNIFKLINKLDLKHPHMEALVSCSNYLEPFLISISPLFFRLNNIIEYELKNDEDKEGIHGDSRIYESHFLHRQGKFYSTILLRPRNFINKNEGIDRQARVSFKLKDYSEDNPTIISSRIDLERESNTQKLGIYFDFQFPRSSFIHKYEPELSDKIVKNTQNTYTHHSFLCYAEAADFEKFVLLCESIISGEFHF